MILVGRISRIFVFLTLIAALWVGAGPLVASALGTTQIAVATQLMAPADNHNGCC